MRRLVRTLFVALVLSVITAQAGPAPCMAQEPKEWETPRRLIEPERVDVPEYLRLQDRFESSRHCGLILSQAALDRLWSAVISTKTPIQSRLGIGIPDPPVIDFDKHSLIWFSDRDKSPGAVDEITVAAYDSDKSIFVTIVVSHQADGSKGLNLWKIPKTDYSPEFNVLHK